MRGFQNGLKQRGEDEHALIDIKDIFEIRGLANTYKQHGAVRAQPKFWMIERLEIPENWDYTKPV